MREFPEHNKLMAIKDKSQAIGEFLENSRFVLCEWVESEELPISNGLFCPVTSINRALAEYFDIDLVALEEEKRRMLDEIRATNQTP